MFGDMVPGLGQVIHSNQEGGFRPPNPAEPPPGRRFFQTVRSSPPVLSIRSFKIAENQTPMPVDRLTFNFNFYDYVNQALNQRFQLPISRVRAYRYVFGFEKTLLDGNASFGMRLPLNNVVANSSIPGIGNSSTSVGDISAYFKYALWIDRPRGRVLTSGFAVTMPTGPASFAGARYLKGLHYTDLQPFLAFQWQWDRWYMIGFSSIDIPTSQRDVLVYFNDLSVGYYVYRNVNREGWLQAIAPTLEAHSNTPMNHHGVFDFHDIAGASQVLDLTEGLSFFFRNRAVFSLGVVEPVTGPRPFSIEAIALFNVYF